MSKEPKLVLLSRKENQITPMLYDILSCITPHPNYDKIIKTIKKYLPKDQKVYQDKIGNLIVKVGKDYTTMFSCHIDMVFRKLYVDDVSKTNLSLFITKDQAHKQAGFIWGGIITDYENKLYIYTPTTLGADDKAGIFILINLIRAKVPGLYIFHVGEEVGGIGSYDIKTRKPGLVKGIKRAIAFDRMGHFDIISRQRGMVCCSLKFVNAFSDQLNDLIVTPNKIVSRYKTAIGTFTDTANYTGLIPECTNLSVGYFSQHGETECLDTLWLETILMPALLQIDWEELPTERAISVVQPYKVPTRYSNGSGWPKNEVVSIGKYVTYSKIDWNTPIEKLPPWEFKKGYIKLCTDVGMRQLIKRHINKSSEFIVQNDILELLTENTKLQKEIENISKDSKQDQTQEKE